MLSCSYQTKQFPLSSENRSRLVFYSFPFDKQSKALSSGNPEAFKEIPQIKSLFLA
jgi:hypothetical protein